MITDKETWDFEKSYLGRIIKVIKAQLEEGLNAAENYKKEAISVQKKMWEEARIAIMDLCDLEGPTSAWQHQVEIANQARKYNFSFNAVSRLERMYQSPYFGRIDFLEEGEEKEEHVYIGINNLNDSKSREILIYDWRAPISSMFYDFETGSCSYQCPAGLINGEMKLKRQFKIENQEIIYMFDSSLRINDEMLQEILGKSTDNRMRTIVTSIQQEQNRIIRNDGNKILIVQGAAGSGKTSIALHRAAYLLYKYRDSIKSENILVFSPNHVFEDYISNVLPELGEENIQRSTFIDYFRDIFTEKYKYENMNEQMEYIMSGYAKEIRLQAIKFKASMEFLNILKNYVNYLESGTNIEFKDVIYMDKLMISAEDVCQLFKAEYRHFPYAKRLEKVRQRLLFLLEDYEDKRRKELQKDEAFVDGCYSNSELKLKASQKVKEEFEPVKNEIYKMTAFDVYSLYFNLFDSSSSFRETLDLNGLDAFPAICEYTSDQIKQGIIYYEDIAPIVFLNTALDNVNQAKAIKHVVIDEAQDYTAIQYEIIKRVFGHCKMTILGDLNQTVNEYMNIGSFGVIGKIFEKEDTESIALTKSYRSSKEIADFCNGLLTSGNNAEQLNRHGSKPVIVKVDRHNLVKRLEDDILKLKSNGHKLIAVICKTAGQCETLFNNIRNDLDVSLISNNNEEYQGGVVLIPSYLAKGLEFDAVLVASIEDTEYSREDDRRLLYTVCSRALHELHLYYQDNLSELIKSMDNSLYEAIQ